MSDAAPQPANLQWKILGIMLVSVFMALVSVSIVNVALPSIQHGLNATSSDIQWVLTGYALIFGVVLVAAGRAGDIFGRGGLFMAGLIVFLIGSTCGACAPTPLFLNLARVVQGCGAGMLNPQIIGMIQQYFSGPERGRAFGYFGSTVGVGAAIGPVVGGFLIRLGGPDMGWRLTMFVNLPLGLVVLFLALMWMPRPLFSLAKVPHTPGKSRFLEACRALDPIGVVLLGLGVLLFMLPFVERAMGAWVWGLLVVSIVVIWAWVTWERRRKAAGRNPIVDLDVLRLASFRNGAMLSTLYFLGVTSIWVIIAMYMQEGLGHSALVSGSIGIPAALLSAVSANWAGKRISTMGKALVVGGMVVATTGMILSIAVVLLEAAGVASEWWLVATMAITGTGQGCVITPNQTLTLAEVPMEYAGSSGALMQVGQRIGTSVGLALITAILFSALAHYSWHVSVAIGFGVIVSIMIASIGLGCVDLRQRRRGRS